MATRARESSKFGYEAKGKMAARSTDVYLLRQGMKDVAVCAECHALYPE